uniref:Odorant receptor n=1 Tax=Meteorus pulchricornis TaxID=51522 RepID=A0A1S5VFJ8_9HYME|nr:olfactory receptor 12 [Meteorus pulchricornis]
MRNDKLSEYYVLRKFIRIMLMALGLLPLEGACVLYQFVPYIHLFLTVGLAYGLFGFVFTHITNVVIVAKNSALMISLFSLCVKLLCMIIYQEDTKLLFHGLDEYFNKLINDQKFTDIVSKGITPTKWVVWFLSFLCFVMCTTNLVIPIIFILHQRKHHIKPLTYILPNGTKYPWAVVGPGLLYKLHYFYEILAIYSSVTITCAIEPLFSLFTIQMIGQFREMSFRMIHLDQSDQCEIVVRQCISQYIVLMKHRDRMQKVFGPVVLQMIITNAIVLSLGIFQLSQMKTVSMVHLTLFITYVCFKILQTFISAWSGTRLTTESENYRDSVYASNWVGNRRVITSVLMMLSQKPLSLTACHFSTISVDMFVSVLNTAMSCFFLLRTLQHD